MTFGKAVRQKISNNLSTNGKVEPQEFTEVRATVAGLVQRLPVHQGDTVKQRQVFAELVQAGLEGELESAQARAAQARADLSTLTAGGRSADIAEIDGQISRFCGRQRRAGRAGNDANRLIGW